MPCLQVCCEYWCKTGSLICAKNQLTLGGILCYLHKREEEDAGQKTGFYFSGQFGPGKIKTCVLRPLEIDEWSDESLW